MLSLSNTNLIYLNPAFSGKYLIFFDLKKIKKLIIVGKD